MKPMSLRATVGLRTHAILIVFLVATLVSAFEQSAGRGIARAIRFLIVIAVLANAIAGPWIRALAYMPDGSHGEGFRRAAGRLTMLALLAGLLVGAWLTTAGRRHHPGWGLVVLVRDLSFWMLSFHVTAVFAWSALMRALQRPLK